MEISFAHEKRGTDRFVAARKRAREHGMPGFVFVKTTAVLEPFLVDFEGPVYIDILAKMIRQTMKVNNVEGSITTKEMLPTHDETWLLDAEGQRYPSELRIVAVDLKG